MEVAILFGLVIGLMAIGVPVAVSLGLSSIVFLLMFSDGSLVSISQTLFSAFDGHYTLLAIRSSSWHRLLCLQVVSRAGSSGLPLRLSAICRAALPLPLLLPV